MKKIIIYNGQLYMGGVERVLISYLKALNNVDDFEVELLIRTDNPKKNIFACDIPKNIKVTYIKTAQMAKKQDNLQDKRKNIITKLQRSLLRAKERRYTNDWLKEYFKRVESAEYIIDFDMSLGKYLDVVPIKKIGWLHSTLKAKPSKDRKRFEKRLHKYDILVPICDEMKSELHELYPSVTAQVERIYNPFSLEQIEERARKTTDLDESDKKLLSGDFILGVSRLIRGKGYDNLIKIFKTLKDNGLPEKLYIIGDGEERANLEKLIEELDLQGEVFLLGQKKNPYPWMKKAKVFAHTSIGEGLPTVLIEAMICGTPVIAYDCPTGPKEILGDGKYGVLINLGDKETFAKELNRLLSNPEYLGSYLDKLTGRVEEFSDAHSIEALLNLISE